MFDSLLSSTRNMEETNASRRRTRYYVLSVLLLCVGVVALVGLGVRSRQLQKDVHRLPLQRNRRDQYNMPGQMDQEGGSSDCTHTVVHAGKISTVERPLRVKRRVPEPHVEEQHYIFTSDEFPDELSMRPSVGNGHVATVLHGPWIQMNGLYNGEAEDSHRATVPSPVAFNITVLNPDDTHNYTLNAYEGVFSHELSSGNDYTLTHRIYAHRTVIQLLVVEVEITMPESAVDTIFATDQYEFEEFDDIEILDETSDIKGVSYLHGQIQIPETNTSGHTTVFMYYDDPPQEIVVPAGQTQIKFYYLTSVGHTQESARGGYIQGQSLVQQGQLLSTHTGAWSHLWQNGRITLSGENHRLARTIWGSFYYILSSVSDQEDPDWDYIGLSPSGLPFGWRRTDIDYMGHIFWDQETWMYPPLLLFHPDIGQKIVQTRIRVMDSAAKIAADNGYEGLQYPWEGAFTGIEVCPAPRYPQYEHHITGDIAFGALQYLYATHDLTMLEGQQLDRMLPGIADFWASRTVKNEETNQYEIWYVMGPDEWHYNVNNSVFTNVIAKISMEAAKYALSLAGIDETRWDDYIDNMYIPFDEELQYHPQFDGYELGTSIKQADVILLGYPLMYDMTPTVRRNDMEIYQNATAETGPAMSWSMYAIGWLEMKEYEIANSLTERNYEHIYNEFQVWREYWQQSTNRGAANFITGMGGFLQTVMNGYGGIRLRKDRLDFDMVLPPDTTEFTMSGISYLGSSVDLSLIGEEVHLTLMRRGPGAPKMNLHIYETDTDIELELGKTHTFETTKAGLWAELPDITVAPPTQTETEPPVDSSVSIIMSSLSLVLLGLFLCIMAGVFW